MWVFKLHYYADIVAVVICEKTQGREGVLRTTTKHMHKIQRSMAGGCMG
jgi:4-aminobutyrate aminotransferase-like enzyme